MSHFTTAKSLLEDLVDKPLTVSIVPSPRTTEFEEIPNFENMDTDAEYLDTTQHTVKIQNEDGEYYARVIIHILDAVPVAELSWVEVVDKEYRGHEIGRTLHEEAVAYIDDETKADRIYTKIEDTRMQGANIDTGFEQVECGKEWYCRE